jgi:hypothetical protein
MSMYLYKYTPIIYTKHICTPKSGHSAASGPPLSRATAAVAAQWWPSSSAAWQNWQTVGKVFRFYPEPYCFGQNWPAFFISHPNKNIILSLRSPNTFWRTERAKIPTQQWVAHSPIKWEPWQGYQQQPPLEQGEQQQSKNTRIYHWNIWAQKLVIKKQICCFFSGRWFGVRKCKTSEGFSRNLRKSVMFWNRNQCLEKEHIFWCRSQSVKSNKKDLKVSIEIFWNSQGWCMASRSTIGDSISRLLLDI